MEGRRVSCRESFQVADKSPIVKLQKVPSRVCEAWRPLLRIVKKPVRWDSAPSDAVQEKSPISGGQIMPVYEYQCQGCRHQFTVVLSITEHDKLKVECPKCKSKRVEQRLSAFYAKTAKKS
jgi:putative FmdB family regulatory protein